MTEIWRYDEVAEPRGFPWPPPEDGSVLGSFGETWKGAALEPDGFFSRLPREGGTGSALIYYLAIGVLVAGAGLFWETVGGVTGDAFLPQELGLSEDGAHPVVGFLLSPAFLLIGLILAGVVTHVMLVLVGGATHGFTTTLRVFCYAYSPQLLGVVPYLGAVVGSVWMVVIAIIGLRAAHETATWKAALAVLLPLFVLIGLMVFALMMLLAAGAALLG